MSAAEAAPIEILMGPSGPLVYELYDRDRQLLYVGMTLRSLPERLVAHRGKPWWPDVAYVSFEQFETAADASRAEQRAIYRERPVHNKMRYDLEGWLTAQRGEGAA